MKLLTSAEISLFVLSKTTTLEGSPNKDDADKEEADVRNGFIVGSFILAMYWSHQSCHQLFRSRDPGSVGLLARTETRRQETWLSKTRREKRRQGMIRSR